MLINPGAFCFTQASICSNSRCAPIAATHAAASSVTSTGIGSPSMSRPPETRGRSLRTPSPLLCLYPPDCLQGREATPSVTQKPRRALLSVVHLQRRQVGQLLLPAVADLLLQRQDGR